MNKRLLFLFWCVLFLSSGCKTESDSCPEEQLPIITVHGALASGDTYAPFSMRMYSQGYCPERIFAFDWNTLSSESSVLKLDSFIREIKMITASDQVYLIGHSAGGNLGYEYLSDSVRAKNVAKYVHIGSNARPGPAGPGGSVPTLNIWSEADLIVNSEDIPGAENVRWPDQDHYQVATSPESFAAIYQFLLGEEPDGTDIVPQNRIKISGKVLTLGENQASQGTTINVYRLNETGERMANEPAETLFLDEKGTWGPLEVRADTYYEFELTNSDPAFRTLHYYREPFTRSQDLVYFRVFPPASSLVGQLLSSLPSDDEQSVVAVFTSSRAVIVGRDELYIENDELSTAAFANPRQSTIAMFLYDNGDGNTSLTAHPQFSFFPFLKAADVFIPTETRESVTLRFNGRELYVRNWKSSSEGVSIAVFD